jgi:hypothetical protein
MRIYRKTEELANQFDAAYAEELSARLEWWSTTLGIDRVRLLRLIGLSARQAEKSQDTDLKAILQGPEWEANAQLLEGGLHRLLSLFHYDLHALAERLHGPSRGKKPEERSGVTSRKGESKRRRDTPKGAASDLVIHRLSEGGPQALPALLACLATFPAGTRRADS